MGLTGDGTNPTLRVATWNIHRCVGSDRLYDPGRVRKVLRRMNADVIALQEVERFKDAPDLLDFLVEGSDWIALHGVTLKRESGHYGNAMLTRLPIARVERQDLSFRQREPRGAIHAQLSFQGRVIHVTATHLGLHPSERRHQARILAEACATVEPLILLGDFNEWLVLRRTLSSLRRVVQPLSALATWPTRRPVLALDRIFVSPGLQPVRTEVITEAPARTASDHLPLMASFRMT